MKRIPKCETCSKSASTREYDKTMTSTRLTPHKKAGDGTRPAALDAACPFPGKVLHKRYVPYKYMQEPSVLITPYTERKVRQRGSKEASRVVAINKEFKRSELHNLHLMSTFRQQVLTKQHTQARKSKRKEPALKSALHKIRQAAINGLQSSRYACDFRSFEGAPLKPREFRRMMKLSFGISLSNAELREVVPFLDEDGDGCISRNELLHKMLRPSTLVVESVPTDA